MSCCGRLAVIHAIMWGVASALFYGTTDFVSHFANETSGVLRTMLYGQLLLAVALSSWLIAPGTLTVGSLPMWAVLITSDLCILLATAFLYRVRRNHVANTACARKWRGLRTEAP